WRPGGPAEQAAGLKFGDNPDHGHQLRLAHAYAAAQAEFTAIEALHAGHRGGPFRPALDVSQDRPDAVRQRLDRDRSLERQAVTARFTFSVNSAIICSAFLRMTGWPNSPSLPMTLASVLMVSLTSLASSSSSCMPS